MISCGLCWCMQISIVLACALVSGGLWLPLVITTGLQWCVLVSTCFQWSVVFSTSLCWPPVLSMGFQCSLLISLISSGLLYTILVSAC